MPLLRFGEYRPDASDFNGQHTQTILNVLPRSDGYGPFPDLSAYTDTLPAPCRGSFLARADGGGVTIFAGTETDLYVLDNTSLGWTEVSKGGSSYSALDGSANWSFAQFNDKVIAVQANAVPQVFDVNLDSEFDDLGGSPPQAAFVTVINRFVVLSGLLSSPRRVHWSGLNAITTWTSGTTYSDYQDLPDGGNAGKVVGGEYGLIIQQSAIRRMIFSPGSDVVFQIDRIAKDVGSIVPWSVTEANGVVFFLSQKGFVKLTSDGAITPIGYERVDRTFLASYDAASPQLVQAGSDPAANVVLWVYKETSFASDRFNKGLAYNYTLDRWAPFELEGEYMASLGKPGVTLEGLGTIGQRAISNAANNGSGKVRLTVSSTTGWTTGDVKDISGVTGTTEANGTHTITVINGTTIDLASVNFSNAYVSGGFVAGSIDDLGVSLDEFSAATLNQIGAFNDESRLGFLTGDALEATITSSEQSGVAKRLFIRGMYPITDASAAYISVGGRENMQATPSYSSETAVNGQGFCPQRVSTRHARGKLRIPAGTEWTFATGVEPDYTGVGKR